VRGGRPRRRHGRGGGAPSGGDAGHEKARRGHERARLDATNATGGSPPRDDDGEEKANGGGVRTAAARARRVRARVLRGSEWQLGLLGTRAGEAEGYLKGVANLGTRADVESERRRDGCSRPIQTELGDDRWVPPAGPPVSGQRWQRAVGAGRAGVGERGWATAWAARPVGLREGIGEGGLGRERKLAREREKSFSFFSKEN